VRKPRTRLVLFDSVCLHVCMHAHAYLSMCIIPKNQGIVRAETCVVAVWASCKRTCTLETRAEFRVIHTYAWIVLYTYSIAMRIMSSTVLCFGGSEAVYVHGRGHVGAVVTWLV